MAKRKVTKAIEPINLDVSTALIENPFSLPPVYSNNAALLFSPHDVRVLFSEVVMPGPSQAPRVELRASVAMSPSQFKAFAIAVDQTLKNYQEQFGEITWPLKK